MPDPNPPSPLLDLRLADLAVRPTVRRWQILAPQSPTAGLPVFTDAEFTKLKGGETASSVDGGRHRRVDTWLHGVHVEPERLAVTSSGVVVELRRQDLGEEVSPLPGTESLTATLQIESSDGGKRSLTAEPTLDEGAGWLAAAFEYGDDRERLEIVDALVAGKASFALKATVQVPLQAASSGASTGLASSASLSHLVASGALHSVSAAPISTATSVSATPSSSSSTPSSSTSSAPDLPAQVVGLATRPPSLVESTTLQLGAGKTTSRTLLVESGREVSARVPGRSSDVLVLSLLDPDGVVRGRAEGPPPLRVGCRLAAHGITKGSGWKVRVENKSDRDRELTVQLSHGAAPISQLLTPAARAAIANVGIRPELFAVARLDLTRVALTPAAVAAPVEATPSVRVKLAARAHWARQLRGEGEELRLTASWRGGARVKLLVLDHQNERVAMAIGVKSLDLRLPTPRKPYRVLLVNAGSSRVTVTLEHEPSKLRQLPAPPPKGPEKTLAIDAAWPLAVGGGVGAEAFENLQQDTEWALVSPTEASRGYWVRASEQVAGEYQYLPAELRLGFRGEESLPGLVPRLIVEPAVGDEDPYRVELLFAVVPWTDPADREVLRRHLQKTRAFPFVDLQEVPAATATLHSTVLDDWDGEQVTIQGGFDLVSNFAAWRYPIYAEALRSPLGLEGHAALLEDANRTIEVRLTLDRLSASPVEVESLEDGGRHWIVLRNLSQERVTVAGAHAWAVVRGSAAIFDARALDIDFACELGPLEKRPFEIPAGAVSDGDFVHVELDAVVIEDVDAATWLDRLNREQADVPERSVTIQVNGLGGAEVAAAGLTSVHLKLTRASSGTAQETTLTPDSPSWTVQVPAALDDFARNATGLTGLVLEVQALYADRAGAVQRLPLWGQFVFAAVPGVERPDSSYRVIGVEPDGTRLHASAPLTRAELAAYTASLAAAGRGWELEVEELAAPVEPDPPEPAPVEPEPDPPTPGVPTITVVTQLLDFAAITDVFLTLDADDPAAGSETLHITGLGSVPVWSPAAGSAAPFAWEATYVLADGSTRVDAGTSTSGVLILNLPSQAGG